MFEILSKIIDVMTSLLCWLSRKQVEAAKMRIRSCNMMINKIKVTQKARNLEWQEQITAAENERAKMEYFLSSDDVVL